MTASGALSLALSVVLLGGCSDASVRLPPARGA
jgi:hypothetical protein